MKKYLSGMLMSALVIGSLAVPTMDAEAATKVKIIEYKNCKALNEVYPGGVAKDAKVKNKGGKTKHTPFVSAELYAKNKKSDRDDDGIACER